MNRREFLASTSIITMAADLSPGAAAQAMPATRNSFQAELDAFIEDEMIKQRVPGVAVGLLYKDEIVHAKAYGRATLEHEVPVTNDTLFQSGSVGKMFTAAATMTQVKKGIIALDEPITKYFSSAPDSWNNVTVRHLLTHTSGIPDHYDFGYEFRKDYTDDELVQLAYALPFDFEPGARWSYSNTGYVLLGILIKRTTGVSYFDILDEEIFKPLGMQTARGISEPDIIINRAAGYEFVGNVMTNQTWVSMFNATADGSLYVSLNDMIAWARGVERGQLLSQEGWNETYTPVRLNSGKYYPYGFGWNITEAGGFPRYHHGGAWQGFRAYFSRYVGEKLSLILLTNSAATELDTFVNGIARLWNPALVPPIPRPQPEPEIDRRVANLIEAARAGNLRQEELAIAGTKRAEIANNEFTTALEKCGPLTDLEMIERRELGDDTIYTYKATFGDRTFSVQAGFAPKGHTSSLQID